jgi:hypothetical protein
MQSQGFAGIIPNTDNFLPESTNNVAGDARYGF